MTKQNTLSWLKPVEEHFQASVDWVFENVFFYEVYGFPIIVVWLFAGAVFFTLRLGFVNLRLFGHGIKVIAGKYSSPDDPGEVTHFQAFTAAVSATVGLGNIAGVAIAVVAGGPGAIIWMVIAGFFAMTMKFTEVTLGQKYRIIDAEGEVLGGPFRYLEYGLKDINFPRLGKILGFVFAICCVGAAFGAGGMFQANQSIAILTETLQLDQSWEWKIALVISISVAFILIGGIKRIAHVAEAVVPFMAFLYIASTLTILWVNADAIPAAIRLIFDSAFTWEAAGGGMLGALVQGFRRATFSNEAGIGSAPIAHAAAKTDEPVREGCVALLGPFIDTIIICFMTGIMITVTGAYQANGGAEGVQITAIAFATVSDWFPIVLTVCICLFAFSTMITWSYYGEKAWQYLLGKKSLPLYQLVYCTLIFLGGMIKLEVVLSFTDMLVFAMSIPNIICLYMMQGVIAKEVKEYVRKLKAGEFVLK